MAHFPREIGEGDGLSIPLAGDIRTAILLELSVPSQDDGGIHFVQFKHIADSIRLLAGNQGATRSSKGVEHDAVRLTAVPNRIGEQVKGL